MADIQERQPWGELTIDEKVSALQPYIGSGKSAAQIADEQGTTRNAIVGFASRQKVPCLLAASVFNQAQAAKAQRRLNLSKADARNRMSQAGKLQRSLVLSTVPLPAGPAWAALPGTTPVSLEHRTGCAWPIHSDNGTLFCNCERAPGRPYCPTHLARYSIRRPE